MKEIQEGDITFMTAHTTTRTGNPARGRINLRQVLSAPMRRDGVFVAVIRSAEDGTFIKEVPLWEAKAGEIVDLTIGFETTKIHPKSDEPR